MRITKLKIFIKSILIISLNLLLVISANSILAATSSTIHDDEYDAEKTIEIAKKLQGYEVKFDYQNYPKEREIAYQYLIHNYNFDGKPLSKEEIGIAMYNLDNDNKANIFVYLHNSLYCGSAGCSLIILEASENSIAKAMMWSNENNDSINTPENILILKNKNLGMNDLLLSSKNIWRWQGKYYSRVKDVN